MDKKYQIDTTENKAWMQELRDRLLAFGHRFPSKEGGAYYLGDDGTPWTDRPRETWITCRMLHVYSIGELLKHPDSRALQEAAFRGLSGELKDTVHGGWYAGVRTDGTALPDKQCYAHAFVMLSLTSAVLTGLPGAEELLQQALELYDRYFWDEEAGLAKDTWNTEFTELSPYRGINANMHTVEAFLAAADVLGEETYRERAGRIISQVMTWAEKNAWRIPEHFHADWTPDLQYNKEKPDDPFKPFGATPGHGIEWARLICQWAAATFGEEKKACVPYYAAAEKLYLRAVEDGWNADGAKGLVYTTDWNGAPVVHDRMHWTLAEAVNTAAVLYRVTGADRYAADYAMFMEYLDEAVLDSATGSWFHQLDQNNRLLHTVWPGKSDLYHAVQATLIPYNTRIGLSVAPAVKEVSAGVRSGS